MFIVCFVHFRNLHFLKAQIPKSIEHYTCTGLWFLCEGSCYRAEVHLETSFHVNLLCANHGSGQSMDCAAQSMDPCFAQQSMDCPLNPWIAQTRNSKYGSRPNHGWMLGSGGLCMNETTFATEAPPGSNCCLIAY